MVNQNTNSYDIIVSGHLCADLIPSTKNLPMDALAHPGKLYEVGPLDISTGGSVSNTGLALYKLGVNVAMMTSVGEDLLGKAIINKLEDYDQRLGSMIAIRQGVPTSYSIILAPENQDRVILHCTGNNDYFGTEDVDFDIVKSAKIFHLGYPPLLPKLYTHDGTALIEIMKRIYKMGVLTSIDMAHPDPSGASGQVNWLSLLHGVMPFVDIFAPSIEEIVFMIRRSDYERWNGDVFSNLSLDYLSDLAQNLLEMGTGITAFKLGEYGFYMRTSNDRNKLSRFLPLGMDIEHWLDLDMYQPAYAVNVVGTTGAGDSAYGGFLAALLRGLYPLQAMQMTCAVGACNVEAQDASSSIRNWDDTLARITAGWQVSNRTL
jgi:sugar/nucleoside kinase (ribokinase family)